MEKKCRDRHRPPISSRRHTTKGGDTSLFRSVHKCHQSVTKTPSVTLPFRRSTLVDGRSVTEGAEALCHPHPHSTPFRRITAKCPVEPGGRIPPPRARQVPRVGARSSTALLRGPAHPKKPASQGRPLKEKAPFRGLFRPRENRVTCSSTTRGTATGSRACLGLR